MFTNSSLRLLVHEATSKCSNEFLFSITKVFTKETCLMTIMTLEAQYLPECTYDNVEFVCKFLMLGDSGVGKTCCVHQYLHGCFLNKFTSTIGMDFGEKFIVSLRLEEFLCYYFSSVH